MVLITRNGQLDKLQLIKL